MKFFLSGLGNFSNNLSIITEAIIEGDKLGFDGALMPDHYMWGQMQFMRRRRGGNHLGTNNDHSVGGSHPSGNVMRRRMAGRFHSMVNNNSTLET